MFLYTFHLFTSKLFGFSAHLKKKKNQKLIYTQVWKMRLTYNFTERRLLEDVQSITLKRITPEHFLFHILGTWSLAVFQTTLENKNNLPRFISDILYKCFKNSYRSTKLHVFKMIPKFITINYLINESYLIVSLING